MPKIDRKDMLMPMIICPSNAPMTPKGIASNTYIGCNTDLKGIASNVNKAKNKAMAPILVLFLDSTCSAIYPVN